MKACFVLIFGSSFVFAERTILADAPSYPDNSILFHLRTPTFTGMKQTSALMTGLDIGYYLNPATAVQFTYQGGEHWEPGYILGGTIEHRRLGIAHHFFHSFLFTAGVDNRFHTRVFGTVDTPGEPGIFGSATTRKYQTYGDAQMMVTGVFTGIGLIKRYSRFNIGLYIFEYFQPIVVHYVKTSFEGTGNASGKSSEDLEKEAIREARGGELTIPRFIVGWSL